MQRGCVYFDMIVCGSQETLHQNIVSLPTIWYVDIYVTKYTVQLCNTHDLIYVIISHLGNKYYY